MSIALSPAQTKAIAVIRDWYLNRRRHQQILRVFGYAGVGKTTITNLAIEALGLQPMTPGGLGGVLFAAFTGKAVQVMTRKGTPAQTIHSLIYRHSEASPEEIERISEELAGLERDLPKMGPGERGFAEAQIAQLKLRLDHIHEPQFVLNPQSDLRNADLLVLDEVSMVGKQMGEDLLAFGKPILVLGDPGQLPPVKGEEFFVKGEPDVMLTEVHRQAAESPILRLASMARQGEPIAFGAFDENVWKMPRHEVAPAQLLQGGQVICGKNATRRRLNVAMKKAAGFDADYPTGSGEKIICLRNRHDLGLINGMFLTLSSVHPNPHNPRAFRAHILTEDGVAIAGEQEFWRGEYDDHVVFDPNRNRHEWFTRRGLIESSWGYAITCHKAQGDSFDTVIVFDEGYGHSAENYNRWLYTAITRAERGLLLLA